MFLTVKIKKNGYLPALLLTLGTMVMLVLFTVNMAGVPAALINNGQRLVIDPGHGGHDGGAVSKGGCKESDLNLAIGLKLQNIAEFYGVDTVMTRVDDSARTDFKSYSEHEDLVHRTEIINSSGATALISIHLNNYMTSQPSGAQILWGAAAGSKELGELAQSNIVKYLEPENRRLPMSGEKGIYILKNSACPAILAECGFMSSFTDMEKLVTENYQTELAAVLFASFEQFTAEIQMMKIL